jgi:hypothetical protein
MPSDSYNREKAPQTDAENGSFVVGIAEHPETPGFAIIGFRRPGFLTHID